MPPIAGHFAGLPPRPSAHFVVLHALHLFKQRQLANRDQLQVALTAERCQPVRAAGTRFLFGVFAIGHKEVVHLIPWCFRTGFTPDDRVARISGDFQITLISFSCPARKFFSLSRFSVLLLQRPPCFVGHGQSVGFVAGVHRRV